MGALGRSLTVEIQARHPATGFDRSSFDALLTSVRAWERVHGPLGLDPRAALDTLLDGLQHACAATAGELHDRGGRPRKSAEVYASIRLSELYLGQWALAACDPQSFPNPRGDRRAQWLPQARSRRPAFVSAALRAIGVCVTVPRVRAILAEHDREHEHNDPGWFFDHRREIADQERPAVPAANPARARKGKPR